MSGPAREPTPSVDLSEVAGEPTEQSLAAEQHQVGDEPDPPAGGDLVPEDDAQ